MKAAQHARRCSRGSLLGALALFLPGCGLSAVSARTGTHLDNSTLYPRLIRLHHAPAPLANTILAKTGNRLFRSLDEGRSFTYLGAVPTVGGSEERCCSTVYELPHAVGALPAGTLLYAGSFFSGGIPAIEISASSDEGLTWQYLATPLRAGDDSHGLWEPEFTVARDGSLVMFVSDETDACCSQKLVALRSRDGVAWSAKADVVASNLATERPGMAIVSVLGDGSYFLSYEVCGPVRHCQVYSRTSKDGWTFGAAGDLGTRAETAAGQYFEHAPANIDASGAGELVLVGQVLYEKNGTVSASNGRVLFLRQNTSASTGTWKTIPAPVQVPGAYDNYCPNYSSALMPVTGGLLELASDYDADHECTSYFAIAPM